ncbi:hypothetical protein SFRURICE_014665 [Spodoptera frugiperda]|nr:hypothetical protein SFRURICE_014665 [Spodoptera frugiperda]
MIVANFIPTRKGSLLLVNKGYAFRLKNKLAYGKKQWYCTSRTKTGCNVDVTTVVHRLGQVIKRCVNEVAGKTESTYKAMIKKACKEILQIVDGVPTLYIVDKPYLSRFDKDTDTSFVPRSKRKALLKKRGFMGVFVGYTDEFVIVVDTETYVTLPPDSARTEPSFTACHWCRVRERIPVQDEECRTTYGSHHCHWNGIGH